MISSLPGMWKVPRIVSNPTVPVEFVRVGAFDLAVPLPLNLECYLQDVARFKRDILFALECRERFEDNHLIYTQTTVAPGKRVPSPDGVFRVEQGTEDDHITVMQRQTKGDEQIRYRHFVDVNQGNYSSGIMGQVYKAVRLAVQEVRDDTRKDLDKIGDELKRLEKERADLDKRIQKLKELEAKAEQRKTRSPQKPDGYVYLLKALHDDRLYKIGRTNNPANRLKTFGVKLPFPVEYSCLIKTDDMYALESELHTRFARNRVDGEWFTLTDDDVRYIHVLAEAA